MTYDHTVHTIDNKQYTVFSNREPFYCFVGECITDLIDKAEVALNDYAKLKIGM